MCSATKSKTQSVLWSPAHYQPVWVHRDGVKFLTVSEILCPQYDNMTSSMTHIYNALLIVEVLSQLLLGLSATADLLFFCVLLS